MALTISSIITVIVVIAVIYLLIKFVIGPIAKIITAILAALLIIYVLQNFFGISITEYIPYGQWLDFDTWSGIFKNIFSIVELFKK